MKILIILLTLGLSTAAYADELTGIGEAKDGDSLMVNNKEVRLVGIDAPEYRQLCTIEEKPSPCGKLSAAKLRALINHKTITCTYEERDKYNRYLGRCKVGNLDINAEMVRSGHAVAYLRYDYTYRKDEAHAEAAKKGIWAGTFTQPETWRRQH